MEMWLDTLNQHIETLNSHDTEILEKVQKKDMQYNWLSIINKWNAIDDTNEKVKKQDARTNSRLSFLNTVKQFLLAQDLVIDIGNLEIELTEKSKDVVHRYYMDSEYNREILEFLYQVDEMEGTRGDSF